MMKLLAALLFLSNLALISSGSKCCQGDNVITSNKRCKDGTALKELNCEKKFILSTIDNTTEAYIDKNENLIIDDGEPVPPQEYCLTTFEQKNEDVYFVCFDDSEDTLESTAMSLNMIFGFISVIFIVLTIVVYLNVPQLLDVQGICLVQSITGLAAGFIIIGIIQLSKHVSVKTCHLLAYLMYTSFLYAFFWLNILSFHIWRLIVNPKILKFTNRWILIYYIFGIGGPILLLLFLLTAHYAELPHLRSIHPGIGETSCWFKSLRETLIYFYGPISVLLCINIVYFVWTTITLWVQLKGCSEKKAKILKYRLLLCIKLFIVMGITWTFEVISAVLANEGKVVRFIWFITDALNGLQGLLIFLLLVVFRKKVIRALANKKIFRNLPLPYGWRNLQDEECEDELEEEISLSTVMQKS